MMNEGCDDLDSFWSGVCDIKRPPPCSQPLSDGLSLPPLTPSEPSRLMLEWLMERLKGVLRLALSKDSGSTTEAMVQYLG